MGIRTTGEGAVSTGSMVAVYETGSVEDARSVAALLDGRHIPAVLDVDIGARGGDLPWRPATDQDSEGRLVQVLVPSTMHERARRVVAGLEPSSEAEEDDDDGDLEPRAELVPELSPLRVRITKCLGIILVFSVVQRGLEWLIGENAVVGLLAARQSLIGEPWRLVTASFIHGDAAHLLSNAAFGLIIGGVLFDTHLAGAVAFVWMASSAAGLGAEVVMSPAGVAVLGASAGNYGLIGLWTKGQLERARVAVLPRWERLRTVGVVILLVPGALTPVTASGTRVAVLAHAMGFAVGLLFGLVFHRRLGTDDASIGRRSRVALILSLVLSAMAWLFAVSHLLGPK